MKKEYNAINQEGTTKELEKYFETKTMRRLQKIGLFCGMDYTSIASLKPIEYYSRLDHSKNVAYTAWKCSEDLKIALTGAFHDVGTLSFSHVNSFKQGNSILQDQDEREIESILKQDEELLEYLEEDKIKLEEVIYPKKYPLIDKEIPALCLDRVDSILATCLFWTHTHSINTIQSLYYMLIYLESIKGLSYDEANSRLKNFQGELALTEDGVTTTFEDFFAAIHTYSKKLLSKEDRYMMELFGLTLKYYEDIGIIQEEDLWNLGEEEVIQKIRNSKKKDVLQDVLAVSKVEFAKDEDEGLILRPKPKIRQANPLCLSQMELSEIQTITGLFYRELNPLEESLEEINRPLKAPLTKETVKILSKYKR